MNHKHRSKRGAALVEGVVGLAMIIGGVVLGTLLLVNVGLGIYYKQKLGVVSMHAAQFAASQDPLSPTLGPDTLAQAQAIATAMGLPTVSISTIDTFNPNFVSVTVNMSGLLVGKGDVLPTAINLSDTGSASKTASPMGYYYFQVSSGPNGGGKLGWVPIYRQPATGTATWHFHAGFDGMGNYWTAFDPAGIPGPTNFIY